MSKAPQQNLTHLQMNAVNRSVKMMTQSSRLACSAHAGEMMQEAMALNTAAMERIGAMQQNWAEQWGNWLNYAAALPEVNTIPKFVDRSNNIFLQAQAQMAAQVTDMTELSENMAVSYSFWLSKQFEELENPHAHEDCD
ncbi:MAG: hypothetical protein ACPGNV_14630 [Mangrovicoccus sp.]